MGIRLGNVGSYRISQGVHLPVFTVWYGADRRFNGDNYAELLPAETWPLKRTCLISIKIIESRFYTKLITLIREKYGAFVASYASLHPTNLRCPVQVNEFTFVGYKKLNNYNKYITYA